ncbi:MAG: hypothetical protein ABI557_16995, partial [Aureliella sp.]
MGRRAKCSKCQQLLVIPTPQRSTPVSPAPSSRPPGNSPIAAVKAVPLSAVDNDDWLNLGEPAIADLSDRQKSYEAHKEAKELERRTKQNKQRARRRSSTNTEANGPESVGKLASSLGQGAHQTSPRLDSISATNAAGEDDPEDVFRLAPLDSSDPRNTTQKPKSAASPAQAAKRSVFEDDLPELSELQPSGKPSRKIDDLLAAHAGEDISQSDPLAALVPNLESLPKSKASAKTKLDSQTSDHEYRVTCSACGTSQYVRLSQMGRTTKCPDCFLQFKIPAPPPGWIPDAKAQERARENDWHSSSGDSLQDADPQTMQRSRTSRMLEKAEQQVSDDDLDRLYDGDFDTADFVQRTFGFLKDPVAMAYIFGYAIV